MMALDRFHFRALEKTFLLKVGVSRDLKGVRCGVNSAQ